jgi:hypothetical protein
MEEFFGCGLVMVANFLAGIGFTLPRPTTRSTRPLHSCKD